MVEDLIRNCVGFDDIFQRRKWNNLIKIEEEKTKRDPIFTGFFIKEKDIIKRIDLYLNNFEKLYGKLVGGDTSPKATKFPVKISQRVVYI